MDATTGSATVPTATCGATAVALLSRSTGTGHLSCSRSCRLGQHILRSFKIKTRQIQQIGQHAQHFPGRAGFAQGANTAWKLCNRPSALTKLPEVSVNGAMGSSTSLNSILVLNGLSVTTISTLDNAAAAWHRQRCHPLGLVVQQEEPLEPPFQHLGRIQAANPGMACTHCAPTVLAASVR
jgi:hypothetical protein